MLTSCLRILLCMKKTKLWINVFRVFPVCLSSKHTALCAVFLKARVSADDGAFHPDFPPTIQSPRTIRESWGVSGHKAAVCSLWRENPLRQCNTKGQSESVRENSEETCTEGVLLVNQSQYITWTFFPNGMRLWWGDLFELEKSYKKEMVPVSTLG